MNEVAAHLKVQWNQINSLSDKELNAACSEALEINARNLTRLALIVSVKESRGHDLSGLRCGMLRYLRKIASGTLLPEVVVRWAERPSVINNLGTKSIEAQREYIESKRVPSHRVPRQPVIRKREIVVDTVHNSIIVTGDAVVLTRNDLIVYLRRLGAPDEQWECAACGDIVTRRPKRCAKCGASRFEIVSSLAA